VEEEEEENEEEREFSALGLLSLTLAVLEPV
jgi:hypothetical protein